MKFYLLHAIFCNVIYCTQFLLAISFIARNSCLQFYLLHATLVCNFIYCTQFLFAIPFVSRNSCLQFHLFHATLVCNFPPKFGFLFVFLESNLPLVCWQDLFYTKKKREIAERTEISVFSLLDYIFGSFKNTFYRKLNYFIAKNICSISLLQKIFVPFLYSK